MEEVHRGRHGSGITAVSGILQGPLVQGVVDTEAHIVVEHGGWHSSKLQVLQVLS